MPSGSSSTDVYRPKNNSNTTQYNSILRFKEKYLFDDIRVGSFHRSSVADLPKQRYRSAAGVSIVDYQLASLDFWEPSIDCIAIWYQTFYLQTHSKGKKIEMGSETKQERFRTRWTPSLDKVFVDLVVEQIQLGNRSNNIFDKKTWNHIRDRFNEQTGLGFNNNQLRKHYDVLRIRYNNLKSAIDQNNFTMEDSCSIGFDLWDSLGVPARPEPLKMKECPIFEQLSIMFADNSVDGKYAQSSHYAGGETNPNEANDFVVAPCSEIRTAHCEDQLMARFLEENGASAENAGKDNNVVEDVAPTDDSGKKTGMVENHKRKRVPETKPCIPSEEEDIKDAMAKALLDMIEASSFKSSEGRSKDERFTISKCIRALDEIEGINESLYFAALDLFETPSLREIFISLNSKEKRFYWLHGKCNGNMFVF